MKPNVGLSISLGLLLSLSISCSDHSSNKGPGTPPPQSLTGTVETTPTPGSGAGSATGPTAPGLNGATSGTAATNGAANTGGTGPGGAAVDGSVDAGKGSNPGAPAAGISIKGLWGIGLGQTPRNCSSIYDLRDEKAVSIHVLCPNDAGKSLAIQSERFALVSDDGAQLTLQRTFTSCPTLAQSGALALSYSVTKRDAKRLLVLGDSKGNSPELQAIDASTLAGDLNTAQTLHGRPVVRGCFTGGLLAKFEAQKVTR